MHCKLEWNEFEYIFELNDVLFVVLFLEKFTDTAVKIRPVPLVQKYFYFFSLSLHVTLLKYCCTVCDIFISSLISNLSLAMLLTCFLSFWESEPHVFYPRLSYILVSGENLEKAIWNFEVIQILKIWLNISTPSTLLFLS